MRLRKRTGTEIEYVQVYGERNSCTDFLSKLLRDNLRNPKNFLGVAKSEATPHGATMFGYKHWFLDREKLADERQRRTVFVVIYRNPYTWIRAMLDRPYALERSLGGRSVDDLPGTTLVGHVNGKDTRNEFHPVTGEQLNLFQLRKLKIQDFESLNTLVDNVVFLNMEELLEDPPATLQALVTEFPSAFVDVPVADRKPPNQLLREYRSPLEFSPAEMELLNANIDWETEGAIGYEMDNYSLKADQLA